jgi:dihydropteroate synthase
MAALDAGAKIVNDISGGLADEDMLRAVAARGVPYVAMHSRGNSKEMASLAHYEEVLAEVTRELSGRVTAMTKAGIRREEIILDPGLGFAKEAEHNWSLLRGLSQIAALGFPVLVGASRKRFLGNLVGATRPDEREAATIALTTVLSMRSVWAVRVHDVKAHRDAISVAGKMR